MSDTVWNLVMQIPLAGVVVLVVVVFLRFLEKMLNQFMGFIREQRESNNGALIRLADEIREMGKRLSDVEDALVKHDSRSRNQKNGTNHEKDDR